LKYYRLVFIRALVGKLSAFIMSYGNDSAIDIGYILHSAVRADEEDDEVTGYLDGGSLELPGGGRSHNQLDPNKPGMRLVVIYAQFAHTYKSYMHI